MRLIKPSFEILESQGYLKDIEIAGRTCYKSEDKITPDSAKEFVEKMINLGHTAMLEHGTVYLEINNEMYETKFNREAHLWNDFVAKYKNNKYSKIAVNRYVYITTNYRVLIENNWLDDLQYLCEPTEFHEKRTTVRFILDRGISHEFVRHRVFSFAQESTRYCNYSRDKFGNEITIIAPNWLDFAQLRSLNSSGILDQLKALPKAMEFIPEEEQELIYLHAMAQAEQNYFKLLAKGWTPQQARAVLPNSLKTELVMTGFDSDWEGFFKLRDNSHAHPQAFELAHPLHEEFIKLGIKKIHKRN